MILASVKEMECIGKQRNSRCLSALMVRYMKKWFVSAKKADFTEIGKKFGITPMTARIIRNRDVIGDEQIRRYLQGDLSDLYSPWLLYGMKEGISLLKKSIEDHEKIRIIGDYDIDGVCSTYILLTGLKKAGANVDTVIPDRIKDGYGINEQLIDRAHKDEVELIVTCDNGIAAWHQIAYAKELGIKVLVTDHHEVPFEDLETGRTEKLPPADVIINPKQEKCTYPWKGLCGGVVAWKLIAALYETCKIPAEEAYSLLEFAAIATVGDIMELQDENRIIVKEGLRRIHNTKNIGLKSLIDVNGLDRDSIGAYHIGFVLGPCINAGGRLDTAKRALELFDAVDKEHADRLAGDLKALNDSRKELTREGVEEAMKQVLETGRRSERVLVVYLPDCHESIAGIIAGKVKERFYRPTIVLTDAEEGIKGSGRSIPGYNMFEELSKVSELFTKFGGHPMAAGMSLPKENLQALRRRLNQNCTLTDEDMIEKLSIDIAMPIQYISEDFINELKVLEPFGNGNGKPLFAERNFLVLQSQVLGKNKNTVKIYGTNDAGCHMEGLYFGNPDELLKRLKENSKISITYYPAINEFRGKKTLQIMIQDFQ